MRNLIHVIDQMLAIIPETEKDLILRLKSRQDSCKYTAPEVMNIRWKEVASILESEMGPLPEFKDNWKKEIVLIWSTQPWETFV